MKKVIGIFLAMVFIVLVTSMAFGEVADEVINFCNDNRALKVYVRENNETYEYNIIGDCGYIISNVGDEYDGMYDFIKRYEEDHLKKNWPEFAKDVKVKFTYIGTTENYEMICVWLKLDNGKVMSDYLSTEPAVSELSGLMVFSK